MPAYDISYNGGGITIRHVNNYKEGYETLILVAHSYLWYYASYDNVDYIGDGFDEK